MAGSEPNTSTGPPTTAHLPPVQQSKYLLPKLHALYTGSLTKTLSKCSYPSFAACFPTSASKKPELLETVHKQIIGKIEAKALAEFDAICQERDLDARFGELEEVIKEARIRNEGGGRGGQGAEVEKGLHTLRPEELFLATLAPQLGSVAAQLEERIEEQDRRNETLLKQLLEKRNEVLRIVTMLEDIVKDMEGANEVLYAASREMEDVPID